MVLVKSKSKSITKQKQKQRQTVIVNINTDKTKSKRQPRKSPKKPSSGAGNSDTLTNPLYYPSVIHSIQQSPQYTMQPNPQEVKDAIREAIRNITHAASKDQYLEQLQHTNDLERQPKTKAENQPEANVEPPIQPELQQPSPGPDLQHPAPIANIEPISIVAKPAQRERTPIETPKENESEIVQYVGKVKEPREKVASDFSRPYLQPINLKPPEVFNPFQGVGNVFNSPFVELDKKTKRENALKAAEERLNKQEQSIVSYLKLKEATDKFQQSGVIPEPPKPEEPATAPEPLKPLPGWEDKPEPQKKSKKTIPQRLSEYSKSEIIQILTDYNLFDEADRRRHKQTLIEKYSNSLVGKHVKWNNYTKS